VRIGMCADQSSLDVKVEILGRLAHRGYVASDLCFSYPDWKHQSDVIGELARAIADRSIDHGILICSGVLGASVNANKYPKIRAAVGLRKLLLTIRHGQRSLGIFAWAIRAVPSIATTIAGMLGSSISRITKSGMNLRVRDENFKDGARPEHYGKLARH
jgi:hypothetical protein